MSDANIDERVATIDATEVGGSVMECLRMSDHIASAGKMVEPPPTGFYGLRWNKHFATVTTDQPPRKTRGEVVAEQAIRCGEPGRHVAIHNQATRSVSLDGWNSEFNYGDWLRRWLASLINREIAAVEQSMNAVINAERAAAAEEMREKCLGRLEGMRGDLLLRLGPRIKLSKRERGMLEGFKQAASAIRDIDAGDGAKAFQKGAW